MMELWKMYPNFSVNLYDPSFLQLPGFSFICSPFLSSGRVEVTLGLLSSLFITSQHFCTLSHKQELRRSPLPTYFPSHCKANPDKE